METANQRQNMLQGEELGYAQDLGPDSNYAARTSLFVDNHRQSVAPASSPSGVSVIEESHGAYAWIWCHDRRWRMFSFLLRLSGIVPWSTSSLLTFALSQLHALTIFLLLLLTLCSYAYQFSLGFEMTSNESSRFISGLFALFFWNATRKMIRTPLFLTFLEYSFRNDFTEIWAEAAKRVIVVHGSACLVGATCICLDWSMVLGASESSYSGPNGYDMYSDMLQMVGAVVALLIHTSTSILLLIFFKFAQIAAYMLALEVMDKMCLESLCGDWSVFVVLIRSMSHQAAKLFVAVTSMAGCLAGLLVYSVMSGRLNLEQDYFFVCYMATIVLTCLRPLIFAGDIRECSLQTVSLINMMDFTDGNFEIDQRKSTVIHYLQASDIGFRVAGQAVSNALSIKVAYIFLAAIISISLKTSGAT